jgi:hypothetical protein
LKRALVMLALAACSHEPRTEDRAPAHPAAALPAVVKPAPSPPKIPSAAELPWAGDPSFPKAGSEPRTLMGADSNIVFLPKERTAHVRRQTAATPPVILWDHKLPDQFVSDAALLVDGETLYLAHYSAISDGAVLHALDLATGTERWSTPVHGLGGVPHSIYANHVVLRMVQGYVVVFGNESGGRYIEVFDPVTGKMQSTALHPRPVH